MLEANDITVWRGELLLLDTLSLRINAGGVLQVQGDNGSGKTTLLRALVGACDLDEGEIYWNGQPISRVRDEFQANLLYLGHKSGISASLSPLENLLALCPELDQNDTRIVEALDALGIGERMHLPSEALSAGQQRRVALARLALQTRLLWVLDEPLTSLDAKGHAWVKQNIERQVGIGGAVVFTTHQAMTLEVPRHDTLSLSEPAT